MTEYPPERSKGGGREACALIGPRLMLKPPHCRRVSSNNRAGALMEKTRNISKCDRAARVYHEPRPRLRILHVKTAFFIG